MPTENRSSTVSHFQREDRYIVIKRSDLDRLAGIDRHLFSQASRRAHEQMFAAGAPARSFLVIESDWPEFESTWAAIEARMTGKPAEQHQGEPVAWMHEDGSDAWTNEKKSDAIAHAGKPGASVAAKYAQPLYTHPAPADAGEVERLRYERKRMDEALVACANERDTLRADLENAAALMKRVTEEKAAIRTKLAERDALLIEAREELAEWAETYGNVLSTDTDLVIEKIGAALSSSTEPSAPACGKCGSLNVDACKTDGCWFEQGWGAPVERDERAEFAAFMHEVVAVTEHDGRQVKVQRQQYTSRSEEEFGWKAWQARAALERKPA